MDLQAKPNKFTKRFYRIRNLTEEICSLFTEQENNIQLSYDVSPNKWQLGHTSWFFENFIIKPLKNKCFNQEYFFLFNSYYNSQGKYIDKAIRFEIDKPSFKEVLDYRNYVNFEIEKLILEGIDKKYLDLIELGLNHEQQHQELILADTKYSLFHRKNYEAKHTVISESTVPSQLTFETISEGIYKIGFDSEGFHYDIEKAAHKFYLTQFEISDRMVTNGEYLEFINDGGYENSLLWHSDGWEWIKNNNIKGPEYWIKGNDTWKEYNFSGLKNLDLNIPVSHVNYYEAWAFAKWADYRLPTEQEWEIACNTFGVIAESNLLYNNFKSNILQTSTSVNSNQYFGNGWEWTESAFLPYPGYKQDKGALGEYNGKFMVNNMVLRGGCSFTPAEHIRSTYRNFYHPAKRWVQSGIRLAKNKD